MKIEEKGGNFVITDFDEFEVYRIACRIEKDGIDFYRRLSGATGDIKTKEALEFLLSEESKHLGFFEDCLTQMRQKGEDPSEDNDLIEAMEYGVFQPYQQMSKLESVVKDPAKAMRLGIAIEDKSIKFYSACREKVSSAETRGGLKKIIEEEEKHRELFTSIVNQF